MFGTSPQYYTSPPSLDFDPQSRGSSSSSSAQVLSPTQTSGSMQWTPEQLLSYSGQDGANEYKPSYPSVPNDIVLNDGQLGYGMPGQMTSGDNAPGLENQLTGLIGDIGGPGNPFKDMTTSQVQNYIATTKMIAEYQASMSNASANFGSTVTPQTLYPQQLNLNYQKSTPEAHLRRSPSPLNEIEEESPSGYSESASPELLETPRQQRRASEGVLTKPQKGHNRRRSVLLPAEEKAMRAMATEGMTKQDKRRVQNKLAQRAFRARSKVSNCNVQTRLDDLERLTEDQANRLNEMSDLVSRLQRENLALKSQTSDETTNTFTLS